MRCESTPTEAMTGPSARFDQANEVIDEMKQHEDFTTSYKLTGVSDASLGSVDRFGYPTDQDSKTAKVYSQDGIRIFIGEKSLVSLVVVWVYKWTQCRSMEICWVRSWEKMHHSQRNDTSHKTRQSGPRLS